MAREDSNMGGWVRLLAPGAAGLVGGGVAGDIDGQWLENHFDFLPDETSTLSSIVIALLAGFVVTRDVSIPLTEGWGKKTYGY